MTQKHLQQILSDYTHMSVDSLIELKNLIEDFPYCQTAQILYLLNLKRLGEDTFDVRLPYTAVCVHSRQRLKENVLKMEELLAQESQKNSKKSPEQAEKTEVSEPLQIVEDRNFQNKTISQLLNLSDVQTPSSTKIKLPKPTADDLMLEHLRKEALAKVNERLQEIRQTDMVEVDFGESSKRMNAAKDLIDNVIATNPKIAKVDTSNVAQKELKYWKVKEEHSLREDYEMVSETLARLYITQGAPAKARKIYKTLAEKFPSKAEYFSELSKQIKNKSKITNTISKNLK